MYSLSLSLSLSLFTKVGGRILAEAHRMFGGSGSLFSKICENICSVKLVIFNCYNNDVYISYYSRLSY